MEEDLVILVNQQDEIVGYAPKMEAHEQGLLHRAVSVLIFNSKGEWLLQQRANNKYHSGGLWSNTACTHPFKNESNPKAAERRLLEEMGMQTNLQEIFSFIYQVKLDKELTEHEFDHVFIGISDHLPTPNPSEVANYRYVDQEQLSREIAQSPSLFTEWFKMLFTQLSPKLNSYL